jgi:CheY-like chemotaxis protein
LPAAGCEGYSLLMSAVVLFTRDLMCSSRVTGAAVAAGARVRVAMSAAELLAQAAGERLVILDLESPGADPAELLPRLRSLSPSPSKVIAFGPHVRAATLQAAHDAGCDEVLTRGEFYARVKDILG